MSNSDALPKARPPKPLTVLINSVSSVIGGGITVAEQLTEAMARLCPHHHFIIFVSNEQLAHAEFPENVEVVHLPELVSRGKRWKWEQFSFPGEARRRKGNVILGLGGYAIFGSRIPQVSVWQNSTVYCPPGLPRPWTEDLYAWTQRQIQTFSMRKAQHNIFLSESTLRDAGFRWNMQRYPHTPIYLGIDQKSVLVSEPPDLSNRPPVAATIGHFYFHKNYENLFEALAIYRDRYPEPLTLEIAGGPYVPAYLESLKQRIQRLDLGDLIHMPGPMNPDEVKKMLSRSRVYVTTSVLETFGLTMFEAMGAGLPVVATDATCHPEVCEDSVFYCDPDSPEDIAEKLHRVVTDLKLSRELQVKGLERIKHFTWTRSAERYLEVLEAVADTQ